MKHEGPFRSPEDAEALERMRRQIESEGKTAIRLPDDLEPGTLRLEAISPNVPRQTTPEHIGFYSAQEGMFNYVGYSDAKRGIYAWEGKDGSIVALHKAWNPPNGTLYFSHKSEIETIELK